MINWFRHWFNAAAAEPDHLVTGKWGEKLAEQYLKKKGLKILGRRVRVGPKAEIDLIAREGRDTLVFIEVKTRASTLMGRPASAVHRRKRNRLTQAGNRYLNSLHPKPVYVRYDIVEVVGHPGMTTEPDIQHIESAFTSERR